MAGMRATDEMVRGFLVWARNYGEIESYRVVAPRGRKWEITLPRPTTASGAESGVLVSNPDRIVPQVFVLTNREAVAFGYGCAAGGNREARHEFARRTWGWDVPDWVAREAQVPYSAGELGP